MCACMNMRVYVMFARFIAKDERRKGIVYKRERTGVNSLHP